MNTRQVIDRAAGLAQEFEHVRRQSELFCEPLQLEDYALQAAPETSPPKWHLAHTTWFFETFVLKPFKNDFKPWHVQFEQLFNSYYNGVGEQFPRAQRGLLSRPLVDEILSYRQAVNHQILRLLDEGDHPQRDTVLARIELGIHHEYQHQELFFTDLKYSFSCNPLSPAYVPLSAERKASPTIPLSWREYEGGPVQSGHAGEDFCFDNETPRHRHFVEPFALGNRLITNREYLAFMQDGGYQRPEFWLADGWTRVEQEGWKTPLYWQEIEADYHEYTLYGLLPLALEQPVCHLSAYEADAFARWAGARLPTEFEWESAAQALPVDGQFMEAGAYHPQTASAPLPSVLSEASQTLHQIFGTLWEWTSSGYSPYPGFQPASGAIGEYNGKFMCNQLVLRGGSCVSAQRQLRASYRNFFYPPDRWQFTGLRLAKSLTPANRVA